MATFDDLIFGVMLFAALGCGLIAGVFFCLFRLIKSRLQPPNNALHPTA